MKKVLIVYQRRWGEVFGQFFIDQFRTQFPDWQVGVLTMKENADKIFRQKNDLSKISWYQFFDPVRDYSAEYLAGDDFDFEKICKELDITQPWEMIHATRNHVKDYRKKFNYAFTPALNDEELVTSVKAYYKLIRSIDDFGPDLIIQPNALEAFHIMLEHYARSKNIPVREVTATSIRGFYQYAQDKNQGGSIIEQKMKQNADYSTCRNEAIAYIEKFRNEFIVPECAYHDSSAFLKHTPTTLGKTAGKVLRALIWNKKLPKGLHLDHSPMSARLVLRDYFLQVKYHNAVKRFKYDELPEGKFVYFPLQMQPELAIDVLAPFFTNQIEVARLIAMSLPAGYTLVVKDHPIMVGRRRPRYLKKLQAQPNVKLINYSIKTPEILNKCSALIVTCGSIVMEAAIMGVPVIQLGNLASSFLLPNVTRETNFTKLASIWPSVLEKRFTDKTYEEKIIQYISLVMQYGIATNYYEIWEDGKEGDLQPFWDRMLEEMADAGLLSGDIKSRRAS